MSTLKIDELKNNGSAIDLPNGIKVGGNEIVQGYTSSGTEPASPATGDFWWDSTNELLYQYLNGEFKAIGIVPETPSFDLSLASYDNVSFSVGNEDASPNGFHFNSDGTKMYMIGTGTDRARQYSLSTGFDLSTASYDNIDYLVSNQNSFPLDLALNSDGSKMYVLGGNSVIYQYSLSTSFNISTALYDSVSFSVSSQDQFTQGIFFAENGSKMYSVGNDTDAVYQYSLTTAFNINTATYDNSSFSVSSQSGFPMSVAFNTDGTKMFMAADSPDSVFEYNLSTGFDLSTASYNNVSFSVSSQDNQLYAIRFSGDGTKFFVLGNQNNSAFQYSIS